MSLINRVSQACRKRIVLTAVLCAVLVGVGCGPSFEERQAKEDANRKETARKNQAKLNAMSEEISRRYDAKGFPPEGMGSSAYTYELQKFFSIHERSNILFRGYLEDVEKNDRGFIIEFLCPLGELYVMNKVAVLFRLSVSEETAMRFLQVKREDPKLRPLRYLNAPDFFVVARINGLQKSRRYEMSSPKEREEVDLGPEIGLSYVSWGKLVEAVAVQNE